MEMGEIGVHLELFIIGRVVDVKVDVGAGGLCNESKNLANKQRGVAIMSDRAQ